MLGELAATIPGQAALQCLRQRADLPRERIRGYANHPRVIETAGDARFEGEVTLIVNQDRDTSDGAREGGYAGSYALVDIEPDPGPLADGQVWTLRGVIFEGEPPPAPEPFVSE